MPQSEVSLEDAHEELARNPAYQRELPTDPVITPEDSPPEVDGDSFLESVFEVIGGFFSAIGPLLKLAVFIAIAALIFYIIFAIVKGIQSRRVTLRDRNLRDAGEDALKDVDIRPDDVLAASLLSEADRLASEGDFSGAIRSLLHSSFKDMQTRIRDRIGISLTAREIGQIGRMPDASRSALQRLISQVELAFFGEIPAGEEEYRRARDDYQTFISGKAAS